MRYALTFTLNGGGYESQWDATDTIIVDTNATMVDWYHNDDEFVKQVLHDYGLTDEQIEFVLPDRYFVRSMDSVDVYGRIRKEQA